MRESLAIVKRLKDSWQKTWNFNYRGWNFFEAVVHDEEGESYTVSAGVMGNKYLSISTAWIVTKDGWRFLNKNFTAHVGHSSDGWRTADGQLEAFFDYECGYEIMAQADAGKIDLRFEPNPDYSLLDEIKHGNTDFDLFLFNHCRVKGYLLVAGEKKRVAGIGSIEHFYGRLGERLFWEYFSLKGEAASVYFRTSRNQDQYFFRTAVIYTAERAYQMYEPQTTWEEIAPNQIRVSAKQDNMELEVRLTLRLANPDNDKQPYINFHFPPFKQISATIFEYCANIEGRFFVAGRELELKGEGICHLTEAVW